MSISLKISSWIHGTREWPSIRMEAPTWYIMTTIRTGFKKSCSAKVLKEAIGPMRSSLMPEEKSVEETITFLQLPFPQMVISTLVITFGLMKTLGIMLDIQIGRAHV